MILFRLLIWSVRLDCETLFALPGIPILRKVLLIALKYAMFVSRTLLGPSENPLAARVMGRRYYYRDALGIASLQRVYCDGHRLRGLVGRDPVVVDVGANSGQFHFFASQYLKASRIVSIEPIEAACRLLRLNARNPDDCFCLAVGSGNGSVEFHEAQASQLSSCLADDQTSFTRSYQVPLRRLDDLLAERLPGRIDLLKIDTEGNEYEVLTAATETLARTEHVLVEMSVFRKSSGNLFRIGSFLEGQGFELLELAPSATTRPRDIDAVFRRK